MVEWTKLALGQFEKIFTYIKDRSPQNAEKVKAEINSYLESLSLHPETGQLDKYVKNNKGSFRFFIKKHVRVHYRVARKGIVITRVRHTKQKNG